MAYTYSVLRPSAPPGGTESLLLSSRTLASRRKAKFRIEVMSRNTSRNLWLRKDCTSFHGDDLLVCGTPNVPEVCVFDRIEIPVCLATSTGVLDPSSFLWDDPYFVNETDHLPRNFGQKCLLEEQDLQWYDFDTFSPQSPEQIMSFGESDIPEIKFRQICSNLNGK